MIRVSLPRPLVNGRCAERGLPPHHDRLPLRHALRREGTTTSTRTRYKKDVGGEVETDDEQMNTLLGHNAADETNDEIGIGGS